MRLFACLTLGLLLLPHSAFAIISGTVVNDGEMLARQTVYLMNSDKHGCTGTVVDRRAVLTAAHCVPEGSRVAVVFVRNGAPSLMTHAVAVARHPGRVRADGKTAPIDVALLILAHDSPPPFRPMAFAARDIAEGQSALIAGYGRRLLTDFNTAGQLRRAHLPVIARSQSGYTLLGVRELAQSGKAPSACQGDSGGPVVVGGKLAGVLSLVSGPDEHRGCGGLTVAMPAASLSAWVKAQIRAGAALTGQ